MAKLSDISKHYLQDLRSDERFETLLDEIGYPTIPEFRPNKAQPPGTWEYYSGLKDGAFAVLSVLKGTTNE